MANKLNPGHLNFNIYESLGSQIISLEEQIAQMRAEQVVDNGIIWNLQLENNAMRQTITKYAKHDSDCKAYKMSPGNCFCGLTQMLKYFGME